MALGKRSRAGKVLRAFRKARRCPSVTRFLEKYGLREYGWSEDKLYDYEQGRTPLPPQLALRCQGGDASKEKNHNLW